MSREVVTPVSMVRSSLPQAGRIRIGDRGGTKGAPRTLRHFRFTSDRHDLLQQLASLYGGKVEAWDERSTSDTWQLQSEASEVRVVLPPDPLGGGCFYESWSGGTCERRCDGGPHPDDPDLQGCRIVTAGEVQWVPCLCAAQGVRVCKPTSRLQVILPDVSTMAVWRLDTKSEHAFRHWPGMVEMVQLLQGGRALFEAKLILSERQEKVRTKTGKVQKRQYAVVDIDAGVSLDAVMSGAAQVGGGRVVELAHHMKAMEALPVVSNAVCDTETFGKIQDRAADMDDETKRRWREHAISIGVQGKILQDSITMQQAMALLAWDPAEPVADDVVVDAEIVGY